MLAKDVKALAADESAAPGVRAVARALEERYIYPVDFQVVDVTGKLYAQAAANELRHPYIAVLRSGLE